MKITLENPIKRDGSDDIKVVELLKPSAGQLRGTKLVEIMQMDVSAILMILPRVTNPALDPAEVAKMAPDDFFRMGSAVVSFFVPKSEREQMQAELS